MRPCSPRHRTQTAPRPLPPASSSASYSSALGLQRAPTPSRPSATAPPSTACLHAATNARQTIRRCWPIQATVCERGNKHELVLLECATRVSYIDQPQATNGFAVPHRCCWPNWATICGGRRFAAKPLLLILHMLILRVRCEHIQLVHEAIVSGLATAWRYKLAKQRTP